MVKQTAGTVDQGTPSSGSPTPKELDLALLMVVTGPILWDYQLRRSGIGPLQFHSLTNKGSSKRTGW